MSRREPDYQIAGPIRPCEPEEIMNKCFFSYFLIGNDQKYFDFFLKKRSEFFLKNKNDRNLAPKMIVITAPKNRYSSMEIPFWMSLHFDKLSMTNI